MQAGFRGALRSTDFLKLWIGQVISMLGDRLGEMGVVALYVAQGARSVTVLLATLSALVIAPQIVVSPWAGALIDRSDRRRVLMVSDGVRAGLVLLLPVAWFVFGTAGVYVVVVLLGTATACFTPAKSAILPLLVPAESLAAGNGMSATTNVLATLVGSYLGAHLAQSLGVDRGRPATPFFIIDALSYGVSALLIWRIARSLHVSRLQPAATDARDFRIRPLLPMLLLAALFWITAAVTYSAMNSFAFVRFHKGILGIGDMQAALGGGMLLGALLAGRDPMPFFAARVWPLLFTTAVGLAVLQAARAWLLAVAAVVVVGAAAAWVLVAVDTHLQRQVPDARRGRIFGLKQQWTALAFIAPSLGLRALTDADATLPALLVATAWILGMVGAAVLWMAILERLDRAHRADWGPRWLNRLDGLNRLLCRRIHGLRAEGIQLPPTGGVLLAANHVSGLDPMLLIASVERPLRFLIARDEYQRWWLRWLFQAMRCIPVSPGESRRALALAQQALADGAVVALFPQGGIFPPGSRSGLKRGVAVLAEASKAPVIAVSISGVRGAGLKIAAVFVPGAVRVRGFPPLLWPHPAENTPPLQAFLAELETRLNPGSA